MYRLKQRGLLQTFVGCFFYDIIITAQLSVKILERARKIILTDNMPDVTGSIRGAR
jgi:hypothetical protein